MKSLQFISDITNPDIRKLGGKGYFLCMLASHGFNIPSGFVIEADAFFSFLKENGVKETIEANIDNLNIYNYEKKCAEIKNIIYDSQVSKRVFEKTKVALEELQSRYVSVRSSSVSEDSSKSSFAGLHDTFLNVGKEPLLVAEAIKRCWGSLFNERAIFYRIKRGFSLLEGMAVVVQEMIPAEISGTAFTAHPDIGDEEVMIIESTWGLGEALVAGCVTPDCHIVAKSNLRTIDTTLGRKEVSIEPADEGTVRTDVSVEKKEILCLNNSLVKRLAKIFLEIEKLFELPQDIEWCISENVIWILQSRPLTIVRTEQ